MTDLPFTLPVDSERIMELLPHRFPFLLVDRVIEFERGRSLAAIKNVTVNEPFFQGHFPGHPVMPGVLVIESMAQAAGLLTQLSRAVPKSGEAVPIFYMVKIDKARFSRTVRPGDQLRLEARIVRVIRHIAHYACRALVDGKEAARAEILCAEFDGG